MKNLFWSFLIAVACVFFGAFGDLKADWQIDDIGSVGTAGEATESTGVFTVKGAGAGVTGTADAFTYMSQERSGDFEITTKVTSLSNQSPYAAVGLALRQNLTAGSANVFLYASHLNGVNFSTRKTSGGSTYTTLGPIPALPVWLRLQKVGSVVLGYMSSDGAEWTLVGWDNMTLLGTYRVGVGVSSAISGTLATAQVDHLRAASNFPMGISGLRMWLRSDAGITKDGSNLVSSWIDQSGNGNDAGQSVSGSRPNWSEAFFANEQPALDFDGTSDFLLVPNAESLKPAQLSIFVVAKSDGGLDYQTYVAKGWTKGYGLYQYTSNLYGFINHYSSSRASGSFSTGSFGLLSLNYNLQNIEARVGNSAFQTASTAAIDHDGSDLVIGGFSGSYYLNGQIAEVLLFNRTLSELERLKVQAYLNEKYNMGVAPEAPLPALSAGTSPSGIYPSSRTITVEVPAGSTVRYTVDGSDPTESSTLYTGAFTIGTNTTIKFRQFRDGFVQSAVRTLTYAFDTDSDFIRDGLKLWLRADQGVTASSGSVSQWDDLSGNNNNVAQATGSNQPTTVASQLNGKPIVRFDGSNDSLSVANNGSLQTSHVTAFVVAKQSTSSGSYGMLFYKAVYSGTWTKGFGLVKNTSGAVGEFFVNSRPGATGTLTSGSFDLLMGRFDGSTLKFFKNGSETASQTSTTPISYDGGPFYLGGFGSSYYLQGDIAEVLIYGHALTVSERQSVERYLYNRYGLGILPPTDAPTIASGLPGFYFGIQNVTLNVPAGATVYYTTNGSEPTTGSNLYSGPVEVASSMTVKFKAFKTGWAPSATLSAVYNIDTQATFSRAGLKLWLRADQGVTSLSGSVSNWNDLSGSNNNASQSTSGSKPTIVASQVNSQPVIRFDGSDFLTVPDSTSLKPANVTVYVVGKYSNGSSSYGSFIHKRVSNDSGWATGYGLVKMNTGNQPGFFINGRDASEASATVAANTYVAMAGRYDQVASKFYVNGTEVASHACTQSITYDAGALHIGGLGTYYPLAGDIAEILIFDHALTEAEKNGVDTYLYLRYGLGTMPITAAPTFSADQPGVHGSTQNVALSGPSGATIRYTTDGTAPTGSSTVYSAPISVSSTTIIKAKAFQSGYADSATLTGAFVIDSQASFFRTGLAMWLRSDGGVTNTSGSVSKWNDLSGNNNDAVQATSGDRPTLVASQINSLPVIRFDGTNDYLAAPDSPNLKPTQVTVFVVGKQSNGSSSVGTFLQKAVYSSTTGYGLIKDSTGNIGAFFVNNPASSKASGSIGSGTYTVLTGRYDGSNSKLFVNGTLAFTQTYSTPISYDSGALNLGGWENHNFLQGDIAEVLVYNGALTDAERQSVEGYLYFRYGVGTQPSAAAPTFDSGSAVGGFYAVPQQVMLDVPAGTTVYYTDDGSEPTTGSNLYSGPISVSSTTTLKFKAFRSGYAPSATLSATYTFDTQTAFTRNGLAVWLRADQGVTSSSGSVSQWNDLSGNGQNAAQATSTNKPTVVANQLNSLPVVRFDGSNDFLAIPDGPGIEPANVTVYLVGKYTNSSGNYGSFLHKRVSDGSSWATGYGLVKMNTGNQPGFFINGRDASEASATVAANTYVAMAGRYDRVTSKFYVNGTEVASHACTDAISYDAGALHIGGLGTYYPLAGDIAEILIFNRALTDVERQEVDGYFYFRYGIGSQPSTGAPILTPSTVFTGTQAVTITSNLPGGTIRYTTDGNDPTSSSPIYTTPLNLSATTTVKARVYKSGYLDGPIITATYVKDTATDFIRDGLKLWLRADVGVTASSSAVSQWMDQSGLGNNAVQPTSTNQPTVVSGAVGGQPVVRFDGSNDFLSIPDAESLKPQRQTIYLVGKQTGGGNSGAVLFKSNSTSYANGYGIVREGSANAFGYYVNNNATVKSTGTIAANNYFLLQAYYGQVRATVMVNGQPFAPVNYSTAFQHSTQPLRLGGEGTSSTYSFGGDIAEMLIFDRPLTVAQQAAVEKYLATRYGVNTDTDADGLPRWLELELGTDPAVADSNGNGMLDGAEYNAGYNPTSTDNDGDGVTNTAEITNGTNPFLADTDGDGINDATDKYPLDPNASTNTDPTPSTAPTITLELPTNAVLLP